MCENCKKSLAELFFEKWNESSGDVIIATRFDSVLDIVDMLREYNPDIGLGRVYFCSYDNSLYSIWLDEEYDLFIEPENIDEFSNYEYVLTFLDEDDPDLDELLRGSEEVDDEEIPVHGFTWSFTDENGVYKSGSFYSSNLDLVEKKMKEYKVDRTF